MISKRFHLLSLAALTAAGLGLAVVPASADAQLEFQGNGGTSHAGLLSFNGFGTPLIGTNIPIKFLSAGGTPVNNNFLGTLTNGLLNFTTGNYDNVATAALCNNTCDEFAAGGTYTITGTTNAGFSDDGIGNPGASGVLITGTFTVDTRFDFSAISGATGTGVDTAVNAQILSFFGLAALPQFTFRLTTNSTNAVADNGYPLACYPFNPNLPLVPPNCDTQAGQAFHINANVGVSADDLNAQVPGSTVPEPASLMLLGSGLSMIGAVIRRRSTRKA